MSLAQKFAQEATFDITGADAIRNGSKSFIEDVGRQR